MTVYFIEEDDIVRFLTDIKRGPLIATVEGVSGPEFALIDEQQPNPELRVARPSESLKSVAFPSRERVAVYPGKSDACEPDIDPNAPQVLVGCRGCDLRAMELLDHVFIEGDSEDPFYKVRRENSVVISVDCVALADTCFCNLVGGQPYAESGYDLNLSPVGSGYVVDIGSENGKELVLEKADLFVEAAPEKLDERDRSRIATMQRLEEKNAKYACDKSLHEIVRNAIESKKWNELSINCVECGACSFICPTCHCFLLTDQPVKSEPNTFERVKVWDSCILNSFSRMAGVDSIKATPRPELRSRFQNRLLHKYVWFFENFERLGCVGCGRCIDACLGGSDLRQVLVDLQGQKETE